jgi:hypothetical protein
MNFDADGFSVLRRLDRWACEHDATIIFDPWVLPTAYSFGSVNGRLCDAPRDLDAFVDGYVRPLVKHLLLGMECRRVTHFSLMNEPFFLPEGAFSTPSDIDPFLYYLELHKRIRQMLDQEQLALELVGPDTNNTYYWACEEMELRGGDGAEPFDVLDHHHYTGRFDYLPPNPTTIPSSPLSDVMNSLIKKYVRYARAHGKPYCITEFGTGYYGWSHGDPFGPASQEAFVTDAEFLIRGTNLGVAGFYRWAYLAPAEYQDGAWQFISTVDGSYQRMEHTFYGFSSLMRYTSATARVWVPHQSEKTHQYRYVHSTALESTDGAFTVLVVNDHYAEERIVEIRLPSPRQNDQFYKILNDRVRKMHRRRINPEGGVLTDCLPPMSLTVYTTRVVSGDEDLPEASGVFTER